MKTVTNGRLAWGLLLLLLILAVGAVNTGALAQGQDPSSGEVAEMSGGIVEPEAINVPVALEEVPITLSPAQIELIEVEQAYQDRLEVPRPSVSDAPIVGPEMGTETVVSRDARAVPAEPMANGDFALYRKRQIWGAPAGSRSNVSEVSVLMAGRYGFSTGNWWAAQSWDGGYSWGYVNPYADMSDFCCDQIVMYDKARDLWIWLRMSSLSQNQGQSNQYRISVSTNSGASWTHYNFNSPTNEHYDYPHWALSNDYLWLTTNKFDWNGGPWTGARMMKLPLDSLRDKIAVSWSFYDDTCCGTIVPVQGATETMYWAGHVSNTQLRIFRWEEDSGTIFWNTPTVPAWTITNRGSANCGNADNWGGRTDDRPLAGWLSRGVIGFMWNVQEGDGFAYPYVNAATFNESDRSYIGRPFIWNPSYCWLYPSVSVNSRGHLGVVVNGGIYPNLYAAIDDDYNGAPSGWEVKWVNSSFALPSDDAWGDYNTSRPSSPTDVAWIGSGHTIWKSTCCDASVWFFSFGRQRDARSYWGWVYR